VRKNRQTHRQTDRQQTTLKTLYPANTFGVGEYTGLNVSIILFVINTNR